MKEAMKNSVILLSVIALATLPVSQLRPTYKLQQENHETRAVKSSPRVSAYECSNCFWNDGVNSVCIDHSVDVKAGWEFTQDYSIYTGNTQYYYKLRAQPYVQVDAVIHPHVFVDKLYVNEVTADLDKFKTYVFGELLYFEDHTLCLNYGWATDDVLFTVQMAMAFIDCYKNLIYTLCDLRNWVGPDAKWIDSCDKSNDEDITLYTWNPIATSKLNQYWKGDGTLADCSPGKLSMGNTLTNQITNKLIFYAVS